MNDNLFLIVLLIEFIPIIFLIIGVMINLKSIMRLIHSSIWINFLVIIVFIFILVFLLMEYFEHFNPGQELSLVIFINGIKIFPLSSISSLLLLYYIKKNL